MLWCNSDMQQGDATGCDSGGLPVMAAHARAGKGDLAEAFLIGGAHTDG
jgi:hypothetical protein